MFSFGVQGSAFGATAQIQFGSELKVQKKLQTHFALQQNNQGSKYP
jgi:hypothetical protein